MAIKSSNQITFTEHKKIIEIKEWYLATAANTDVTKDTAGWTTDIQAMDHTNKYLWNYEEVVYSIGSPDISEPVIIGVYGDTGSSLQIKYMSSEIVPIVQNNDVSAWSDTIPAPQEGYNIYMIQKLSTDMNWSIPIQISGSKGDAGEDGTNIEYIYYRSKEVENISVPSYTDGILTSGWTTSPQGITEVYKYEYVSVRIKPSGEPWGSFSSPVIWSKWGEKGQDGDGVEYKYYLSNSSTTPTYSNTDPKWTDDPQGVSIDQQYEYVVQIKTSGTTVNISQPSLWAKYGEDGIGISEVKNYYCATLDPELPVSPKWLETAPELSPTNKFLWNYESIIYTSGDKTDTRPAIIGVYGDSGTSAITFEVYSTQGFVFEEGIEEIELRIAAFDGVETITGIPCTWSRWDSTLNGGTGDYALISESTVDQPFIVHNSGDNYYDNLRCSMLYNGNQYDDYVNLTHETTIYFAVVNFFNGSNVFDASSPYIVVYVDLYRNNKLVESILTDRYYSGTTSVSNGIITTDMTGTFANGDLVYFIYRDGQKYRIALGEYQSGSWKVFAHNNQYKYINTLYDDDVSNIIVISRNDINKSANIVFNVYNNDDFLSTTNVTVIDTNDPIVSSERPQNANNGQLWLDTSSIPYQLYIYEIKDGVGEWRLFSQQNGGAIYTSRPDSYSEGDLWILADGETCLSYTAGTMLKASTTSSTFNEKHWTDTDPDGTIKNIKESFSWDNSGIRIAKRVVDSNDNVITPFYVHIDSTRMGFHSVEYNNGIKSKDVEVVHIGNNSATIQNATFQGGDGTKFENTALFEQQINMYKPGTTKGFTWKIEKNGSLSLSIT